MKTNLAENLALLDKINPDGAIDAEFLTETYFQLNQPAANPSSNVKSQTQARKRLSEPINSGQPEQQKFTDHTETIPERHPFYLANTQNIPKRQRVIETLQKPHESTAYEIPSSDLIDDFNWDQMDEAMAAAETCRSNISLQNQSLGITMNSVHKSRFEASSIADLKSMLSQNESEKLQLSDLLIDLDPIRDPVRHEELKKQRTSLIDLIKVLKDEIELRERKNLVGISLSPQMQSNFNNTREALRSATSFQRKNSVISINSIESSDDLISRGGQVPPITGSFLNNSKISKVSISSGRSPKYPAEFRRKLSHVQIPDQGIIDLTEESPPENDSNQSFILTQLLPPHTSGALNNSFEQSRPLTDTSSVHQPSTTYVATSFQNRIKPPGSTAMPPASRPVLQESFGSTLPANQSAHPWDRDVQKALRKFGLTSFRTNQEAAVNAALSGQDVFILMPTGGGKSLCYQLPATLGESSGAKTFGLTVVVSPLISLMQDQVETLISLGIPTVVINGDMDANAKQFAYDEISRSESIVKMVYVTPEMMGNSSKFQSTIRMLYQRKRLARFVIDEAHCVSQWGHDFRPDYKDLSKLRSEYPGTPIMALTATANDQVKLDIVKTLKITGCKTFTQSFNRTNLFYEVRKKSKSIDAEIISLIQTRFARQSGVIYCTSRQNCEDLAITLNKAGLMSTFYHAGLEKEERRKKQEDWKKGKTKIIIATIAFGMGIDKADVRFVIHYTFPQSLEGYYQETGRAGRDGKQSWCIMFYSFGDKQARDKMIAKGDGNAAQKERLRNNLRMMIAYCEDKFECRRKQVLQYFGETFDKAKCNQTCDNCKLKQQSVTKDVTKEAKDLVELLQSMENKNLTLIMLMDTYKGANTKKIRDEALDELPLYGKGSQFSKTDIERLTRELVIQDVLCEETVWNKSGYACCYARLGKNSRQLLSGKLVISLLVPKEGLNINERPSAMPTLSRSAATQLPPPKAASKSVEAQQKMSAANPRGNQAGNQMYHGNAGPGNATAFVDDDDDTDISIIQLRDRCFKELKESRRALVMQLNPEIGAIPPETFSDAVLYDVSRSLPQSVQGFKSINGVDASRYEKYGKRFLEISRKYADEMEELSSKLPATVQSTSAVARTIESGTNSRYFGKDGDEDDFAESKKTRATKTKGNIGKKTVPVVSNSGSNKSRLPSMKLS